MERPELPESGPLISVYSDSCKVLLSVDIRWVDA